MDIAQHIVQVVDALEQFIEAVIHGGGERGDATDALRVIAERRDLLDALDALAQAFIEMKR